jgi:hypothetical protein
LGGAWLQHYLCLLRVLQRDGAKPKLPSLLQRQFIQSNGSAI